MVITGCADDNLGSVQFQSKYTLSRVYVPLAWSNMMVKGMCCSYDSDATISHMNPRSRVMMIFIVHIRIQCRMQRYW